MTAPTVRYDEESDSVHISFASGENAIGIELTDHILLRINKPERRAIGLTILDYSLLAQPTEVRPRSFPLNGLTQLSTELRELVLNIVRRPPVSDFLTTPSTAEMIPITSVRPLPSAA